MNSGFISPKRTVARIGVHQRFDMAAYKMIAPYLPAGEFPTLRDIIHFEGYYGPDGLKVKSRGINEPSHLYDPKTEKGEALLHIKNHYRGLVECLKAGDMIRAAFEASWMAHYVGDGLTPAHHWPLEDKIAEAAALAEPALKNGDTKRFAATVAKTRMHWAVWGSKGHLSTHFYFETGIMFALLLFPIRPLFTEEELARAGSLGAIEYFKAEALDIASADLYERFYRTGWTADIATSVKNKVAPQAARCIGMMWLLALLEAGFALATEESASMAAIPGNDDDVMAELTAAPPLSDIEAKRTGDSRHEQE